MRTTIWRACGFALLGSVGFAAAYGLAGAASAALPITTTVSLPAVTVPPLPTTTSATVPLPVTTATVATPTLPVTVPVPVTTTTTVAPPPVTVATPPPPASVPPPPQPPRAPTSPPPPGSSPPPPPPPRTSAASAPQAAGAPAPSSSSVSSSSSAPAASPAAARESAARSRSRAQPQRIRNRGKARTAAVVRFRLPRAARVVLVVRGPGPSCDVAARIPVRGRAGANRYRFTGRVKGEPLEPGTYLLTPRRAGRTRPLAREHVTIVDPDAPNAPRVLPRCGSRGEAPSFLGAADKVDAHAVGSLVVLGAEPSPPPPDSPPLVGDVRGEATPEPSALPLPSLPDAPDELPPILGIVLLGLLAGSLIGVAVAVVHYLRSA